MESKITKQEKNPFLHRDEYIIEIDADSTPSFAEVAEIIGKDKELIVIKKIYSNFGRHNFTAEAVVYNSKENKDKVEVIPRKIRKKIEEERKKAEDAAKVEEAKKEKVEEVKTE